MISRSALLVALACCVSASAQGGEWALNKFSVRKCDEILKNQGDAARTLNAILVAVHAKSCSDVTLDARGRTKLTSIDLHGQGLKDLSPFRLFTFVDGEIDLSNNVISDVTPLIDAAHGVYRINLSQNKIRDARVLAQNFSIALVLNANEIDDPGLLGTLGLVSDFSLRGNRSSRGVDYDRALESTYRFYALFSLAGKPGSANQGIDVDALRACLATQVAQFISLKNASVEDVVRDARRFYQKKSEVKYRVHLDTFSVARENGSLLATFAVDYVWNDHELGIPDEEAETYPGLLMRGKSVKASATVTFDSSFRIVAYVEKLAPRRKLKVVEATWGTARVADVVKTIVNGTVAAAVPMVGIPKGTILESDFEHVSNDAGGKLGSADRFDRVVYKGKPLWVRASSSGEGERNDGIYLREQP